MTVDEDFARYRDGLSMSEWLETFVVGRRIAAASSDNWGTITLTLDDGVIAVIESGSEMSPGFSFHVEGDTPKDQLNHEPT